MENKHQHIYTASDIRDYLEGRMNPAQMHAIEKAALDDRFLADAIEGYSLDKPKISKATLEELKLQLQRRINKPQAKVVRLHPGKTKKSYRSIAAVFLLLAACTILYFVLFNDKKTVTEDKSLATNTTSNSSSPVSKAPVTEKITPQKDSVEFATSPVIAKQEPPSNSRSFPDNPAVTTDDRADIASNLANTKAETDQNKMSLKGDNPTLRNAFDSLASTADVAMNDNKKTSDMVMNKSVSSRAFSKTVSTTAPEVSRTFAAQVLGSDNSPLPFAKVNILNGNIGTYADAKGNFILVSTDSLIELEVKSVGYLPKYYNIRSNGLNKIVLEEDKVALKKVTEVTTASTKKLPTTKGRFIKDSVENVEPADGWDLYGSYVDNNIELPDDVLKNKVKGTVEISFEVKRNGNISNAKVDKSLCNDCDEEALRLIKQGPQWKVKKGRKARSKVKVQF